MKSPLRKALKIAGAVLGALVLLAAVAALLVVFDKPLVRKLVLRQLNKAAGMTVDFARLDYTVFPLSVSVDSLELVREDAFQKLTVSLGRLEARGSLGKILRGKRPALESLEVRQLDFRLEQKAKSEEPFDVEALLLQASDALAWAKRVALTGARLDFGLLAGRTVLEDLDLALEPDTPKASVVYDIGRSHLDHENRYGTFGLTCGLGSSGTLRLVAPFAVEAEFTLGSPRLVASGAESALDSLRVAVTGRFDRSASDFDVSRLEIAAPGLFDLEGRAAGRFGHSLFIEAAARARIDSLERAAELAGPRLPEALRALALQGRAELSGTYGIHRTVGGSKDDVTAALTLEAVELTAPLPGQPARLRCEGRIEATGPTTEPRLSADLRLSSGALAASGVKVAGADLCVAAAGGRAAMDVSRLEARFRGLELDIAEGRSLAFGSAAVDARGSFDPTRGTVALASLEARLPGLAPLRASGRLGFGKDRSADLRFESRGLDLAAVRTAAAPFVPAALAGWELAATADLALAYRRGAKPDDWGVSGMVSLAGATFNDPSFTIAGEGLDPVLRFEGVSSGPQGLSLKGSLAIGQGESLWKAVYLPWAKFPLELAASGRYDLASGAVDGLAARATLPGIGTIDAGGAAGPGPSAPFDLRVETDLSLGPLYSLYTEAGVSEESRMKLEGKLAADLRVGRANGALSVAGRVRLTDAALERPLSKTLLTGITADIPLHYASAPGTAGAPDAPPAPAEETPAEPVPETDLPERGFLRVRELSSPFLSLSAIDLALRGGPNAFGVEPVSLDVFGGRLELGRTTFRYDPAAGSFRGLGSLALRDVDIAEFPVASPEFKLTGKIRAEFPRLDIGTKLVGVAGRGEAEVFGGRVVLRDLAVNDPFTPGRSISLNVDLVELDLKKLTDEVPFGEVTGIVSGEVRDLVITYGEPARFDFRLESVPRKGVPRTFSLKAVDNLTVLSSGQQASAGAGGFFMRFVRGFRYEKLGIVSTLRNDTFTLNGTIHEGGVEYLVKKPALFGISVVNREPGKVISFKEMTSRLKRVGQSER
jgi:hypothetical protein